MIKLDQDTNDGKNFNHVIMTDDFYGFIKGEIVWVNLDGGTYASSFHRNYERWNVGSNGKHILDYAKLLNGTWWKSSTGSKIKILKFKSGSSKLSRGDFVGVSYSKDIKKTINLTSRRLNDRDLHMRDVITEWSMLETDEA